MIVFFGYLQPARATLGCGPMEVVFLKIRQASHQLLVGVEVVDPGEIIARKDVLRWTLS